MNLTIIMDYSVDPLHSESELFENVQRHLVLDFEGPNCH